MRHLTEQVEGIVQPRAAEAVVALALPHAPPSCSRTPHKQQSEIGHRACLQMRSWQLRLSHQRSPALSYAPSPARLTDLVPPVDRRLLGLAVVVREHVDHERGVQPERGRHDAHHG